MDFYMGDNVETVRREAREFLAEVMTPALAERIRRTGTMHDDAFAAALARRRWIAADWPEEFGGFATDVMEMYALNEELARVSSPVYGLSTTQITAGAIKHFGTDAQRRQLLPSVARGEVLIVLGFSEPECGSDVAAVRTRAVRDGDEWVINGQKMFTTNGHVGDRIFLLTRTNPDVAKHKGLTTFLVPLSTPGIEVQPVFTMAGERTNITYLNEVRISDDCRIGEVDNGWTTMTVALTYERVGVHGLESEQLVQAAEAWAATPADDGVSPLRDPAVRRTLARAATETEVSSLLSRRAAWLQSTGELPSVEGSMSKLFASETLCRQVEDLTNMLGPDGIRSGDADDASPWGVIEHMLRAAQTRTVRGGTSEVQRSIIAQRGLGLPRSH